MTGLVPAILFTVIFQELDIYLDEDMLVESYWGTPDLEGLRVALIFDQWVSTAFMWSGMALVAAYMTLTHGPNVKNV